MFRGEKARALLSSSQSARVGVSGAFREVLAEETVGVLVRSTSQAQGEN